MQTITNVFGWMRLMWLVNVLPRSLRKTRAMLTSVKRAKEQARTKARIAKAAKNDGPLRMLAKHAADGVVVAIDASGSCIGDKDITSFYRDICRFLYGLGVNVDVVEFDMDVTAYYPFSGELHRSRRAGGGTYFTTMLEFIRKRHKDTNLLILTDMYAQDMVPAAWQEKLGNVMWGILYPEMPMYVDPPSPKFQRVDFKKQYGKLERIRTWFRCLVRNRRER
jgi:predicted metal-dependent peptidase